MFLIIKKRKSCGAEEYKTGFESITNTAKSADTEYKAYIKKHGYHFTEAIAEYASKLMKNGNNQSHSWTAQQVKKSMESLGLNIPKTVTLGDVTYLANMYYADLYPDPLKDEASCLRAAYKLANDVEGMKA